jgi:hypothetical protein
MFILPHYLLKLTTRSKDNSRNILSVYSYYSLCIAGYLLIEKSIIRLKKYNGDVHDGQYFCSEQFTSGKKIHGSFCD